MLGEENSTPEHDALCSESVTCSPISNYSVMSRNSPSCHLPNRLQQNPALRPNRFSATLFWPKQMLNQSFSNLKRPTTCTSYSIDHATRELFCICYLRAQCRFLLVCRVWARASRRCFVVEVVRFYK